MELYVYIHIYIYVNIYIYIYYFVHILNQCYLEYSGIAGDEQMGSHLIFQIPYYISSILHFFNFISSNLQNSS